MDIDQNTASNSQLVINIAASTEQGSNFPAELSNDGLWFWIDNAVCQQGIWYSFKLNETLWSAVEDIAATCIKPVVLKLFLFKDTQIDTHYAVDSHLIRFCPYKNNFVVRFDSVQNSIIVYAVVDEITVERVKPYYQNSHIYILSLGQLVVNQIVKL